MKRRMARAGRCIGATSVPRAAGISTEMPQRCDRFLSRLVWGEVGGLHDAAHPLRCARFCVPETRGSQSVQVFCVPETNSLQERKKLTAGISGTKISARNARHARGRVKQADRPRWTARSNPRVLCVIRAACRTWLRYMSRNMMANASVATHMSGLISLMRPLAIMMMQKAMKPRPMPLVME